MRSKVLDFKGESCIRTDPPLQDPWDPASPLLAGLIAHLFQVTLQDEMAATTRRLVQLGTDVLNGSHGVLGQVKGSR